MSRRASTALPLVGLVALLVGFPFFWRYFVPRAAPAPAAPLPASLFVPAPPDADHVDVALLRAGISPRALAAVGASGAQVSTIAADARAHLQGSPSAIAAPDAAYAAAKRESDRLRRLIESGKSAEGDVQRYQTQMAALAAATSQQAAALGALFDAATASLTAPQRQALRRIQVNATWELPVEFTVLDRTQAQWVELRSALANERFCAEYGETMDGAASALLASARADASVAAASSGLDANLSSITSAWNAATAD